MTTIREKIGTQLLNLRREAHITQEEAAQRAGVSTRTITNIENGNFNPRLDVVQKIASAYDAEIKILKNISALPLQG